MITVNIPVFITKTEFDDYKDIPNLGGLYVFFNGNEPIYVGKCSNLKTRIYEHMIGTTNTRRVFTTFESVKYFIEECPMSRDMYETYLINKMQPVFNTSKCFLYKPKYVQLPHISKKIKSKPREIIENRCMHIKNDGVQCKNYICENGYCGIHKRKHINAS